MQPVERRVNVGQVSERWLSLSSKIFVPCIPFLSVPLYAVCLCAVCLYVATATAYAVRSIFALCVVISMRRRIACRLFALRSSTAKFERSTIKRHKKSGVRFTATALCCVLLLLNRIPIYRNPQQ